MRRREFIKSAGLFGGAALINLSGLVRADAAQKPQVQRFNEIGRTGLKMSDISFGCGKLSSPSLILRAYAQGINYFDTAPDYGESEVTLGKAIKKIGKRAKMIVASKFCNQVPYPGHVTFAQPSSKYIEAVEGSLKRLKTDYLDICLVHAIGEGEGDRDFYPLEKKRLFDENMLRAAETLKKSGKIRFLGVSSHGPHSMERLMMDAVNSGHFDLIMPAFNFMKFPGIADILKEAKKKGVGVIAMKTLAGAKDSNVEPGAVPFEHAAFKWVLKHREVDGLIVTIKNTRDLDHYLKASGQGFAEQDQAALDSYRKEFFSSYCRTGCGDCIGTCPEKLNIPAIMRFAMYFQDYGMEKRAMASYASLERPASVCADCENKECEGKCPYGLPVGEMLSEAHRLLSFSKNKIPSA